MRPLLAMVLFVLLGWPLMVFVLWGVEAVRDWKDRKEEP